MLRLQIPVPHYDCEHAISLRQNALQGMRNRDDSSLVAHGHDRERGAVRYGSLPCQWRTAVPLLPCTLVRYLLHQILRPRQGTHRLIQSRLQKRDVRFKSSFQILDRCRTHADKLLRAYLYLRHRQLRLVAYYPLYNYKHLDTFAYSTCRVWFVRQLFSRSK